MSPAEPIEYTTKRYRCPHCPRSLAKRSAMVVHIDRCWYNPAARSCKTCRHLEPPDCCGEPQAYGCYTPMCPTEPTCVRGVELPAAGEPNAGVVIGCAEWES